MHGADLPEGGRPAARPQAALTIDTDTSPARALLIRGVAATETVGGVPDEYIKASAKTMDRAHCAPHGHLVFAGSGTGRVVPPWPRAVVMEPPGSDELWRGAAS